MFFYVVSRTYAEIFSLLRFCSGFLSNTAGLLNVRLHVGLICANHALTMSYQVLIYT